MPRPTFLCVGSQKCGTTWLSGRVRQHPEVCTARQKEVHFFDHADKYPLGLSWYESQFECSSGARAIGEFSPNYFWTVGGAPLPKANHSLGSAERIAEAYPDIRLIVMLRDPVDRAVSGYYHNLRAGRSRPDQSVRDVVKAWPNVLELGRYDVNLARWFDLFPREAFLVLIYEEDVKPDAAKRLTIHRVFEHIGVDPSFVPNDLTARSNTRNSHFDMRARNAAPLMGRVMRCLPASVQSWPMWDIPVSDDERAALAAEFAPGVARLEEMLGRELPWETTKRLAPTGKMSASAAMRS